MVAKRANVTSGCIIQSRVSRRREVTVLYYSDLAKPQY